LPYRFRRRRRRVHPAVAAAAATLTLAVLTHTPAATGTSTTTAAASGPAATAIAYARAQLGKPYEWGGTGPGAYDCSGLVWAAYQSAGVDIPRTSQAQWAALPHVPPAGVRPGDLVFFPGSDGTFTAPGHVALVIGGGQMIQAYAAGTPIEVSALNGDGAGGIVGYARPGGT
jgi:cell wall-associated NlpC family hydrolase